MIKDTKHPDSANNSEQKTVFLLGFPIAFDVNCVK